MPSLAYASRCVRSAESIRQRIGRTGRVGKHDVWTPDEDAIVRAHYPDYAIMSALLPRRSRNALKDRARKLNVAKKKHIWTTHENSRLRRMYLHSSPVELLKAFPGMTTDNIRSHAKFLGMRKENALKKTPYPVINSICERACSLNYSMVDVDAIARSGDYFKKAGWFSCINYTAIGRAVAALDGRLCVEWND